MNNDTIILDDEQRKIAVNLFRYVLWASSMMGNFETTLVRDRSEMRRQLNEDRIGFDPKLLETEMYQCLWFGTLYIVIEGWPRLRIRNQKITGLLRSPYKKLLRKFRNATFHPEDYDDERIGAMIATGQSSIEWAREVTGEFKRFFESLLLS
jgi:hypothetical protein